MKIRMDFVTNSSSSSFIIGKAKQNNYTVEDVYTILKKLYLKYEEKKQELITYIDKHPNCLFEYTQDETYTSFNMKSDYYKLDWNEIEKIQNKYMNMFGFEFYNTWFPYKNLDEIIFDSYTDYFNYWKEKIKKEKTNYLEIPFTICDLRNENDIEKMDNIKYFDYENQKYELNLEKQDLSKNSFLLDWYLDLYNADKRKKRKFNRKIRKLSKEYNPIYGLLGQICIYSEDGNIPYCIVDELKKISQYSESHMG